MATTRMTRAQIVEMGRSGDPWAFMAIGAQALRIAPADDAIRFLLAVNLARLGLRTLADEQLGRLGDQVRELDEVRALASSLRSMPDDRVPTGQLIAAARANLRALADRADHLPQAFDAWRRRIESLRVFRASDGNHVRRLVDRLGDEPHQWHPLINHSAQTEQFCARHLASIQNARTPIYLEGLDPPTLLERLHAATPAEATGFAPLITVIQRDPLEALDGLALADLTDVLQDERVKILVGSDASRRLLEWARDRLDTIVVGPALTVVGTRTQCEPTIEQAIESLRTSQTDELARLRRGLDGRYRARDQRYWGDRWSSPTKPLRVLVSTCRFSTYLQHASRDLAAAFRAKGCEADVLIEPDDNSRMSVLAYLGAVERIDPDLIVVINYPRSMTGGGALPGDIPFVNWIQDAMPHLYERGVGEAMGDMDFVVGPIDATLVDGYAYPPQRCLAMPVVVSEEKFHAGEVDCGRAQRFDCEIACVTHHSETPEAMRQRLKAECGGDANTSMLLDEVFERVRELVSRSHLINLRYEIRELVHRLWNGESAKEDARRIIRGYAIPLGDRIYRHQALEWAAQIARERDWRFHLHGNGWDRHPTLSEFARGPIEHGEDLRSVYRSARANLHICLTSILHQRVSECFLSGGLPICRVMPDHLSSAWTRAQLAMVGEGCPYKAVGVETVREGVPMVEPCREFAIADSEHAMRMTALSQSLGLWHRPAVLMNERRLGGGAERLNPAWRDASRMLPMLGEHAFVDREGLERALVRGVERPPWRGRVIEASARSVREHLTLGAMIDKTTGMIRDSIHARQSTGPEPARAERAA